MCYICCLSLCALPFLSASRCVTPLYFCSLDFWTLRVPCVCPSFVCVILLVCCYLGFVLFVCGDTCCFCNLWTLCEVSCLLTSFACVCVCVCFARFGNQIAPNFCLGGHHHAYICRCIYRQICRYLVRCVCRYVG